MKNLTTTTILLLTMLITTPGYSATKKATTKPIGDDYQKPNLIDCQAVFVEPMQPVHNAKTMKTCFYEVSVGDMRLVLVVTEGMPPYYVSP